MSKAGMARTILTTTPGVVADTVFRMNGISRNVVRYCGLNVSRVHGFGWKLAQ